MIRRLGRFWRRLIDIWHAAQVELHGQYSVGRLLSLRDYCERTSTTHSLLVLAATPLPCLLTVVLIEAVPLRPPSDGLDHTLLLWVRMFLIGFGAAFETLQQYHWLLPRLPTSNIHIFAVTAATGIAMSAAMYSIASVVGFPLPFTLLWAAPFSSLLLVVSVLLMWWGSFLAQNHPERRTLVSFFGITGVQMSMIFVYPAYAHFFNQLSTARQIGAMALVPFIKLTMKNAIARVFRDQVDLVPDAVVFNVEVFHALFLSWCMNGSTSKTSVLFFLLVDALEGAAVLFEVRDRVHLLEQCKAHSGGAKGSLRSGDLLVETAAVAMELDGQGHDQRTTACRGPMHPRKLVGRAAKSHRRFWPGMRFAAISSADTTSRPSSIQAVPELKTAAVTPPTAAAIVLSAPPAPMDNARRREILRHARQLLHLSEFILLIEFTEVMIPTIYNLYLLAVYQLPNRAFLTNIRDLSLDELSSNMQALLGYSLLEIASLLVVGFILQRQTRVSALRQLAFVLGSQWQLTQAKLLIWVVFTVQTPLEHYGSDFFFRFAWLRHPVNTTG